MRRYTCFLVGMLIGSARCLASDGDFQRVALEIGPARSDGQVREQLSGELARRATQLYRDGNFEAAYVAMRDALQATSPSHRALADFSLMAVRAGHPVEAIASGREVILDATDPGLRAAAWFNTGLACELLEQSGPGMAPDCSSRGVLQFLNAWGESPTPDREHKIVDVIDNLPSGCTVDVYFGRHEDYYLVQTGEPATIAQSPQRIVVRHARGSPPPADVAEFAVASGTLTRRTYAIREFELSRVSISVLQGLGEIRGPVRIRGEECRFD